MEPSELLGWAVGGFIALSLLCGNLLIALQERELKKRRHTIDNLSEQVREMAQEATDGMDQR